MSAATSPAADVVDIVLPAGIDDPAQVSGGNRYDRLVCDELRARGWAVHEHAVAGDWPYPRAGDRDALAEALSPEIRAPQSLAPEILAPETPAPEALAPEALAPETPAPKTLSGDAADDPGSPVLIDGMLASAAGDLVAAAARERPVSVLAHMPFGADNADLAESERVALSAATTVLATSSWTKRYLIQAYQLPSERIHVACPGADHTNPAAAPAHAGETNANRMLCVAAVARPKGHDVLVRALEELSRSAVLLGQEYSCVCAGSLSVDPRFAASLRHQVARAGLSARVEFTGPLASAAVDACYDTADLVVVPSRTESWGMVVTEALAHALPVVASDVGGIPEALGRAPDGSRPGLLVSAGDPVALAQALSRWQDDARLRRRLRTAARARSRVLPGWAQTASQVSGALTAARVIGPKRPAPAGWRSR
jgi:glycosyltransferase involved in cell wall biosynthesis